MLARCNLQPDFAKFVDKNTPDARINNYTRLQPTLAKLGVPLDTRVVTSLVREERGVASRLVYRLKSVVDSVVRDVERSKRGTIGTLAKTTAVPTRSNAVLTESHRSVGAFNTAKAARASADAKIFEDTIRAAEAKPNHLMEEAAVSRFRAEGERQDRDVFEHTMTIRAGHNAHVASRRTKELNAFNARRETKAVEVAAEYATHAELLEARREVEKREVEIELALEEKARLRRARAGEAAKDEAMGDIDDFERRLERVKGASKPGEGDRGLGSQPPAHRDPAAHLEAMRSNMPDARELRRRGEKTVAKIKDKRQEALAARRERDRRRHKLLVDQSRAAEEAERARREEELLATLGARSMQETRVAERLKSLELERDRMRSNRADRDRRYEEQRAADWEAQLRREAKLAAQRRAAYRAEAAEAAMIVGEVESARERERAAEVKAFVKALVLDVAGLAAKCGEYRAATDKLVPRREYREWKHLVLENLPLPFALPETEAEAEAEAAALDPVAEALNDADAMDYVRGRGDWAPAAMGEGVWAMHPHDGGLGDLEDTPEEDEEKGGEEKPEEEEAAEAAAEVAAEEAPPAGDDEAEPEAEGDAANDAEGGEADEDADPSASDPSVPPGSIAPNVPLGSAVFVLAVQTLEIEPAAFLPDVDFDARLAVVGAPFCGKSTAARRLAEARELVLIEPDEVLRAAMEKAAAWRADHPPEEEETGSRAGSRDEEAPPEDERAPEDESAPEDEMAPEDAGDGAAAADEGDAAMEDVDGDAADPSADPSSSALPSREVALGLVALDSIDETTGLPSRDPSVLAGLVALAIDALAPKVEYPPPVDELDPEFVGPDAEALEAMDEDARSAALEARRSKLEAAVAARDATIAELEAEAKARRPRGFVIDGFPSTRSEAAALEKALTGLDPAVGDAVRSRVSAVAPPTPNEIAAKADPNFVSGLDAVVFLDLPQDRPDAQPATLRALGRRVDPETGAVYHLDYDPPPEDEPGLAERLRDLVPPNLADVEKRLAEWSRGAEDLESWFAQ